MWRAGLSHAFHSSLATVRGFFGAWRSLVARLVRDQEVPSSNLGAPTIILKDLGENAEFLKVAIYTHFASHHEVWPFFSSSATFNCASFFSSPKVRVYRMVVWISACLNSSFWTIRLVPSRPCRLE